MSRPRPLAGLIAGAAAGLVASAAIRALQPRVEKADGDEASAGGTTAQYLVGAAVGGAYGVLAEYRIEARGGFDIAYGVATGALLDHVAEAAAETLPEVPTHNAVGHIIFGAVLEGVRTLLAGRR